MNKNTLITIIVLALVAGGAFLFLNNSNPEPTDQTLIEDQEEVVMDEKSENEESEEMNENESNSEMANFEYNPSETAVNYVVSEGTTVSYVVQKRFLSKPTEEIIATTDIVSAKGWNDVSQDRGQIEVMVNLDDLVSDSEKRDEDIMALFESQDIKLTATIDSALNISGDTFTATTPAELTINNVTKTVDLNVTGEFSDTGLTATGSTKVLMSSFNVNPPSLANVYTVDDEMELQFNLVATVEE